MLVRAQQKYSPDSKKRKRHYNLSVPFYPFKATGFKKPTFNPQHMRVLLEEFPQGATMSHAPYGTTMLDVLLQSDGKDSDNYWQNVNLVVKAAAYRTIKESELQGHGPFLLLHAFLQLVCCVRPFQGRQRDYSSDFCLDFIDWIKYREPQQFRTRNLDGRFPIHIAMQNTSLGRDGASQLWRYLVKQCPESAGFADPQGRLPLHEAIVRRLNYRCIDVLAEAEPRAVTTRVIATHLYPFERVAYGLAIQQEEVEHARPPSRLEARDARIRALWGSVPNSQALNTMYKLLRMAPHVARTAIREPYVDTPEYLEFQRNKLVIAQIELESHTKRKAIEKRNEELQTKFERFT